MAKGTVDFFNDTGGYGFIETDDADDDVFFHMEDVGGPDLEEGQEVEFDIEEAEKGHARRTSSESKLFRRVVSFSDCYLGSDGARGEWSGLV